MYRNHYFFLILCLFFLLTSCAKREVDIIRVTSALPGGVINKDTVLVLKFSKGVVKQDSINLWMSTPFIEFSPAVPGKFVWQDTSTLVFSPDIGFTGDTKFNAKINTDLIKQLSGAKSFKGNDGFTFATESFYLIGAEFFYERMGEKRTIGIKTNLEFTYAVNPAEAAKFIKVTIDKAPWEIVTAVTTQNSRIIPLELGPVTQTDREKEISITFDNQLISTETNTHIRTDKPFIFKLPGIEELKIYGHEYGFDGTRSWITIKTNQEVDSASARAFISLNPSRDFTLEGDRQSITLRGKFEPGTSFRLLIKKGLESVLQGKTLNDYEADVHIGNIKPSFSFTSESGTYMLLSGERKIEIKTVNLSSLMVRVSQIFQNNLVFFLDGGRHYGYYYYDEEEDDYSYTRKFRYTVGNYGRQLYYDSIKIKNVVNQEVTTHFDLNPFLKNDYKGFYLLEIANPSEKWQSTAKLISLSNIGLIVKKSADELIVFAANLETTEPIQGAAINLISTSNQIIAAGKTDKDGAARFDGFKNLLKDFHLKLVTAEIDNDFNFINLSDYLVENSRFDVDGKWDTESMYDAFLYGDRNIYRPGETIYLSGIIRNLGNVLPAQMPVKLKIFNPRGTMVKELQRTLNEEGSFELNYETSMTALTGTYRFELYTGNNIYLSSYNVSVEDFVPDRLKVDLIASQEKAKPGEKITYELQALNFFGPPAADRKYEFEGTFTIIPYISKNFREFRFSDAAATNYSGSPFIVTGKTDSKGKATIEFPLPQELTSTGLLRARGRVAVFDESGRPVYQIAQTTIYPKNYFIGIQNFGYYYVKPNTQQKFKFIAVDANDKPIDGFKAKIEVIRLEWHSVLRQHPNDQIFRYVSEKREIIEKSEIITLGTKPLEYVYSASRSGEYLIRVSKQGETGYNQFGFYSYSWGTADITSFKVDPEARIQIVLNDSVYKPGDRAKILFKTPFSGKMLVTIERNQVFSYRYLDVRNNAAEMEIQVDEKFLPNVYVSAVLFRKIKDMNIPLLAGHGFEPLMVEKKSNRLDISIHAPDKIRPKRQQVVTIKTGNEKNVFVTLAAVDEGICQLKNYKTPDPYKYFYSKKALQTETYNFFKHLLPEPERSSPGGGDDAIAQRVNPLGVKRFVPVALWSGILKTNADGIAEVSLDVPEFSGELRLMALAYKGDRFGSAQRGMKVADPVVITPALPRFMSPNDSIIMQITAFNTTNQSTKLKFNIEASGGIIAPIKTVSLELEANQERYVTVPLKSTNQIGKATLKVKTNAFGEDIESVTELPIRPVSPFASEAITGFIEAGDTVSHNVEDIYLQYGRKSYITLSPFPVANFAKELKHLVGYPHGCLEQTVSKAFPQIYLRDIAAMLDPSILNTGSPTYFVNEAITKVVAMQVHDGAFSYWPGTSHFNNWTTVYATHFLLEARKAGYAVPDATVKAAVNAITHIARSKNTQDYYHYGPGQKITVKRIADKSTIYALYVLAAAGSPEKSVMNFYRTDKSLLTADTRYLLAGSFALSGDMKTYLELLPPEFITEKMQRETGYNFDSPIRSNAIILNVLLETDLDNPNIPRYMEYLSKEYKNYSWCSTQDNAFTLLAFGKAARMALATKVTGKIKVGNKDYKYDGGTQKIDIDPFGKMVTTSINGTGRVFYSIVTEGIRTDGKGKIEDKNLKVRRDLFDRFGNPVNPGDIKQNDLVIVKLTVNSSVERLENVAITDLLPGGFEIENPRISETTEYSFMKNQSIVNPEYLDIRDDRINIYISFHGSKREQVFYYMVRAVTAGDFQHAPIVAEAMYDANYYSAHGGGKVKVLRQ